MEDKRITQENYADHIEGIFENHHEALKKGLKYINDYKGYTGYQEIPDITTRAFNAVTRGMKYLNDHQIDYKSDRDTNYQRLALDSWETYVGYKYKDTVETLCGLALYVKDNVDKIHESPEYKSRIKQRDMYSRLTLWNPTFVGVINPLAFRMVPALNSISYAYKFKDGVDMIKEYHKKADEIWELNPKEEFYNAVVYYFELLYKFYKNQKYVDDVVENDKMQDANINYCYRCFLALFLQLGRKDDIERFTCKYLDLIKDRCIELRDNFEQQYKEFKSTLDNKAPEVQVEEKPKRKGLFNRKKKSNSSK